jgi:hypothetical protein
MNKYFLNGIEVRVIETTGIAYPPVWIPGDLSIIYLHPYNQTYSYYYQGQLRQDLLTGIFVDSIREETIYFQNGLMHRADGPTIINRGYRYWMWKDRYICQISILYGFMSYPQFYEWFGQTPIVEDDMINLIASIPNDYPNYSEDITTMLNIIYNYKRVTPKKIMAWFTKFYDPKCIWLKFYQTQLMLIFDEIGLAMLPLQLPAYVMYWILQKIYPGIDIMELKIILRLQHFRNSYSRGAPQCLPFATKN